MNSHEPPGFSILDLVLVLVRFFIDNLPWFGGVVVALVTWRRHPKVSRTALLGFGVMIGAWVCKWGVFVVVTSFARGSQGYGLSYFLVAAAYGEYFFRILGGAIIVVAVFAWREPDRSLSQQRDKDVDLHPYTVRPDDPGIQRA